MRLFISQLHQERVWSQTLPFGDQLSHDDCVVGRLPESSGPPFVRCDCRGVKDELLGVGVVGGGGLQAADESAVAHLGLGVSPDDLQTPSSTQPLSYLLISTLNKRRQKVFTDLHSR